MGNDSESIDRLCFFVKMGGKFQQLSSTDV